MKQWNTPPTSPARLLVQNAERVVFRLARVDHDRQAQRAAPGRICSRKTCLLHVARREVVVVVEADLADRARQRLAGQPRFDKRRRRGRIGGELSRRVRMHADRQAARQATP